MHDSWLSDYVADSEHASCKNTMWTNEFIYVLSEMREEEVCV